MDSKNIPRLVKSLLRRVIGKPQPQQGRTSDLVVGPAQLGRSWTLPSMFIVDPNAERLTRLREFQAGKLNVPGAGQ